MIKSQSQKDHEQTQRELNLAHYRKKQAERDYFCGDGITATGQFWQSHGFNRRPDLPGPVAEADLET